MAAQQGMRLLPHDAHDLERVDALEHDIDAWLEVTEWRGAAAALEQDEEAIACAR